MKAYRLALLAGVGVMLAACAGPVVLGINLGTVSTVGSLASTAATGRGLGEHAVSALADQDCRFIEPLFRDDRDFCEPYDSPARKDDFKGVAEFFEARPEEQPTMVADAAPQAGTEVAAGDPEAAPATRAVETVPLEPIVVATAAPPPAAAVTPVREGSARAQIAVAPPPKAKPAAERIAPATGPYSVRVGSYANATNAEAFARKLRSQGYQTRVSRVRGQGKKMWSVVHITGFRDAVAAERAAAAIARDHDAQPMVVATRA